MGNDDSREPAKRQKRYELAPSDLAQNSHEADEPLHFLSRRVANVLGLQCEKLRSLARSASGVFGAYQNHEN